MGAGNPAPIKPPINPNPTMNQAQSNLIKPKWEIFFQFVSLNECIAQMES